MFTRTTIAIFLALTGNVPAIAADFGSSFGMTEDRQWIEALREQIRPGLRRSDVEKLLIHRDVGSQSATATRYLESSTVVIEVPYDQTGGPWAVDNRVSGPIVVHDISPTR